jgi:hypothetical protein
MMIRWDVRMRAGQYVAGALVALTLAACNQNPAGPRADTPLQLDSLRLELSPTGEVLVARGFLRGGAPVSPEVSFSINVSTDGGDVEDPRARWTVCHTPDDLEYACHQFIFQMEDGHVPAEIAPKLDSLGMRLFSVYTVIPGGAVQVLSGTDEGAFHALQALPHVNLVEYNRIVSVADLPKHELTAALPVDQSAVAAGNAALELEAGQTVTARYQQPDGSVLTATLHM